MTKLSGAYPLVDEHEIGEFDRLTPVQKFELYESRDDLRLSLARLLLALDALDESLKASVSQRILYLFDDESLVRLINRAGAAVPRPVADVALFYLTLSQTVYRFTAALKFDVIDPSVKQLRINSWGKLLCKNRLREEYAEDYQSFRLASQRAIIENMDAYRSLSALLEGEIDSAVSGKIASLNQNLEVRLAS